MDGFDREAGVQVDAVTQELPGYMRLAEAAQEVVLLGNKIVSQIHQTGAADPDLLRWYETAKIKVREYASL